MMVTATGGAGGGTEACSEGGDSDADSGEDVATRDSGGALREFAGRSKEAEAADGLV